ncbi:MAG: DNA methyltransferase [Candidatus Uhrbacteria bacterium]
MPTELTWDGKYNADGTKKAPLRVELPFQTVETVNESAQERQRQFDLFSYGQATDWRNRLIWGDKKYVLPSLLPEFAGKVDLIYIDPPFATGDDFSFDVQIEGESFIKEPSILEQKAYRDTWGRGLDSYLQWFYETAIILKDFLTMKGSLFVHLDDNVAPYAKVVLDEIFGIDCYQNEIIWQRTDPHNDAKNKFGNIHDTIFWYGNSRRPNYYPEATRVNLSAAGLAEYSLLELPDGIVLPFSGNEDKPGRRFKLDDATWKGNNPKKKFVWRGASPSPNREWMYTFDGMEDALAKGELFLRKPEKGAARCKKSYLDLNKGILLQDIWTDTGRMKGGSGYATQKPESLLERIIKASSNEGDLVLDCFCGSGTTAATAEKLGRRWITCDLGRFAIHTARKRLLAIPNVKPFVVQNLGKYERQLWQAEEFGPNAEQRLASYTRFIVELYQAQPLTGFAWLHGVKGGRVIHVGSVDSPVTLADIRSVIREWRSGLGKTGAASNGIDVLGWEFAFELNETAKQQALESGVDVRFLTIPREVLEKKAVEQGDIQFFELAALFVEHTVKGRELTLELTNFIAPLEYVPLEVREKITKWTAWIDYWAVDFNFRDDTFHNEWQSYRTRKEKGIESKVRHTYPEPGTYHVQVKVIDILGNDTTRTITVTTL